MADSERPSTDENEILPLDEVVVNVNHEQDLSTKQTSTIETLPATPTNAREPRPSRQKRPKDDNKTEVRLNALEKEIKELATLLKLAGVYQLKTSFTQQPEKKAKQPRSRRPNRQQE